jgi:hydroxyacylglutathione hydrolase
MNLITKDIQILQIPVLQDNYAYVVIDLQTKKAALIDTPDSAILLQKLRDLAREGIELTAILNTHHHGDHAGGNAEVLAAHKVPVSCGFFDYNEKRIDGATHPVKEGDDVQMGNLHFQVLDVPGHTLGHIAYYGHGVLFCGDTVFVSGCGRLFEGTAAQMFDSLAKIKKLPDDTLIYCAHEYSEQNLCFALTVDPNNAALQKKYAEVKQARAQNQSTVPTHLGDEKLYNPFLRTETVEDFARVRKLKDGF